MNYQSQNNSKDDKEYKIKAIRISEVNTKETKDFIIYYFEKTAQNLRIPENQLQQLYIFERLLVYFKKTIQKSQL